MLFPLLCTLAALQLYVNNLKSFVQPVTRWAREGDALLYQPFQWSSDRPPRAPRGGIRRGGTVTMATVYCAPRAAGRGLSSGGSVSDGQPSQSLFIPAAQCQNWDHACLAWRQVSQPHPTTGQTHCQDAWRKVSQAGFVKKLNKGKSYRPLRPTGKNTKLMVISLRWAVIKHLSHYLHFWYVLGGSVHDIDIKIDNF